jgi:hypothetical protein
MTLAILLVVFAVITLFVILRVSVSRSLSRRNANTPGIEPIDVEAFRNLVNPTEDEYLHRRLPAAEFRRVQRERLRAAASYIRVAGRNATVLVAVGQAAMAASDQRTAEAARQLVDSALLLRRNTTLALMRINLALAWPSVGLSATPVLSGYERLNSSAMLLGRLQNPAMPVRISSVS